jgi:hypothetical protein
VKLVKERFSLKCTEKRPLYFIAETASWSGVTGVLYAPIASSGISQYRKIIENELAEGRR